ncbi:hypothetical protein [Candidatus Nitrosocosmicus hydrocola]|uniref:hypothetical protein n=1 Tax=Candidatus Nitrosocosmicus hydrocola TaxID=1826872 RepID=UPI0011E607DB|nr:hypothetical protein [Candidatus Nitrosocosmicus hydrocola]
MASANNFGIEKGKSDVAMKWINEYLVKNNKSFKISVTTNQLDTLNFGTFDLIEWHGDWSIARNVVKKVSSKLNIKVVEAGYHKKGNIVESFFGMSQEYCKVYSSGKFVGTLILKKKSGDWIVDKEKRG